MRNVLVSFNDYVCDWHVCLSVKFWQKYICSDATRPPLKIGKNFIFPRKTWKIIFSEYNPVIYTTSAVEKRASVPHPHSNFPCTLLPLPPPPYPFPEEYDANIRQGRTEDLFFYFNSGVLILLPTFSLGSTGELSNLTKVFSWYFKECPQKG